MGLVSRIFGRREAKSNDTLKLWREFFGGNESASSVRVTAENALECATVLACVREIAEGCGALPFKLYRVSDDGRTRLPERNHPVARVLRRPNDWQTPQQFVETLTGHAALCGSGYALIGRGADGRVLELLPLNPAWVEWKQGDDWSIRYTVRWPKGQAMEFAAADMFALPGYGWDGVAGLSAVKVVREAIGLGIALERQQARLVANGARPGGFLSTDKPMNEGEFKRAKDAWNSAHGGIDGTGATALLAGGLKWNQITLSNVDAQTMEQRGHQIEDICRGFGIYPQVIGYYGKQAPTYASAEQFFIQHDVRTTSRWVKRWEQAVDCRLLTEDETDSGLYAKISLNALMRADVKTRAEYYARMHAIGAISSNEIRGFEEMNPYDGGDTPRVMMNTIPADQAAAPSDDTQDDAAENAR